MKRPFWCATALLLCIFSRDLIAQTPSPTEERTGRQLFEAACAACHGVDGKGAPVTTVGFDIPLPDFTDCRTASREPDEDWLAVAHGGGPARSFNPMMPSFRDALTEPELRRIVAHLRTLCTDKNWARGDLNLPRPLFTEKAFPEDEAVLTVEANAEGEGSISNELIYERRLGARNQFEFALPFSFRERSPRSWIGGIGDMTIAYKRVLHHSVESGSIFSAGSELIIPTGNRANELGSGSTVIEPFAAFGKILPSSAFLQLHSGFEIPTKHDLDNEFFWRAAFGKTFTPTTYGRAWTPIVEVLSSRSLESGAETSWDLVPQLQVSLSKRQHVLFDAGVRLPLSDPESRTTQLVFYVIWDWFDGGLFSGW